MLYLRKLLVVIMVSYQTQTRADKNDKQCNKHRETAGRPVRILKLKSEIYFPFTSLGPCASVALSIQSYD